LKDCGSAPKTLEAGLAFDARQLASAWHYPQFAVARPFQFSLKAAGKNEPEGRKTLGFRHSFRPL
jgi:hypothetical protein